MGRMGETVDTAVEVPGETTGSAGAVPTLRVVRRIVLLILGPLVAASIALWVYLSGGRYETTDDAYVQTSKVAISADVTGRVKEIAVADNQVVHRGDVLFRLDDAPFRISVEEAAAQLSAARLKVDMLKANYRQRESELESARANLRFAKTEHERQMRLSRLGIASQSQVDQASHALDEGRARLAGVKQEIGAVLASLAGDAHLPLEKHPDVQKAQAMLDRARLNLSYTEIRAPSDGTVTRVEELQEGSAINAATPVFALVSSRKYWIEANFKEDQLTHMRPGQTATIRIDTYPDRSFKGRVASVSPGTGSQFSMLPPENATGNWVKVVQRLPVRLELDAADAEVHLRSGLSADVSVDTKHQRRLPWLSKETPAASAESRR